MMLFLTELSTTNHFSPNMDTPSTLTISLRDPILSSVSDEAIEESILALEGTQLLLTGQKLLELPTFLYKKRNDTNIVDYVTAVDVSVNELV